MISQTNFGKNGIEECGDDRTEADEKTQNFHHIAGLPHKGDVQGGDHFPVDDEWQGNGGVQTYRGEGHGTVTQVLRGQIVDEHRLF